LSAVCDCLFNILAATLHIGGRSSIRNLRTHHVVVRWTHLSRSVHNGYKTYIACLEVWGDILSCWNSPSVAFNIKKAWIIVLTVSILTVLQNWISPVTR
jgi:hypothetical protein